MKHLKLTFLALLFCIAANAQLPAPIAGPSSLCDGTSITLTDATPGGTWTSSFSGIAVVGASTGIVSGVSAGVVTITYTITTGSVTHLVTVWATPPAITGPSMLCLGSTITLSNAMSGGTWTSATPSIATVGMSSGVVTGIIGGIVNISYTSAAGCSVSRSISVNTSPSSISGTTGICIGGTGTLTCTPTGGTWSSSNPAITTVDPVTGVATGHSAGSTTITYTLGGSGCIATTTVTISPGTTAYTMTGGGSFCSGGTGVPIGLSGSVFGVTYQLYRGTVAVGSPVTGTGMTLSFGLHTVAGVYTIAATSGGGCVMPMTGSVTVGVDPLPAVYTVTGGGSYCSGGTGVTIGLAGSSAGISYQLYFSGTPIGSPIMGTGAPLSFGLHTTAGTYTIVATNVSTGCASTMSGSAVVSITSSVTPSVTVSASPGTTICAGTTVTFTAAPTSGGTAPTYQWYKNGTAISGATASSYVTATLTSGDSISVDMTSSAPCATPAMVSGWVVITVSVPSVTASATSGCGGITTLTAGGGVSYFWSPSTGLSCATCGTTTMAPAPTTVYTVTGTDGFGCTGTATVSVNGNRISGHITYTGTSSDSFRVWLIQYNPSDSSIIATDSTTSCMVGGTAPYYEFMSAPAGNYLVKAMLFGTVPGTSGYIPTYGLSTPNWYSATGITHASGMDSMHINMVYGTVPAGPGFISGYVYAGAGKGTAGDAPEPGMLIYLKDGSGNIITYTYTDAAGAYSFSGLGYGSYVIYPEEFKYYTTPYGIITLSASNSSVTGIRFKKRTSYGTITPETTGICCGIQSREFGIFPNPTTGMVSMTWPQDVTGHINIQVSDMTGREVFHSSVNATANTGETQLELKGLEEGMYIIQVKTNNFYYSGKILIQQ